MSVEHRLYPALAKRVLRYFVGRIGRPNDVVELPNFDMRPMDRAEQILALHNMNFVPHRLGDRHIHSMNRKPKNVGHFYNRFGDTTSHSQPLRYDLLIAVLAICSRLGCNKYFVCVGYPTYGRAPYSSGVPHNELARCLQ